MGTIREMPTISLRPVNRLVPAVSETRRGGRFHVCRLPIRRRVPIAADETPTRFSVKSHNSQHGLSQRVMSGLWWSDRPHEIWATTLSLGALAQPATNPRARAHRRPRVRDTGRRRAGRCPQASGAPAQRCWSAPSRPVFGGHLRGDRVRRLFADAWVEPTSSLSLSCSSHLIGP